MKILWITPSYSPSVDGMATVASSYVSHLSKSHHVEVRTAKSRSRGTSGAFTLRRFSIRQLISDYNEVRRDGKWFDKIIVMGAQYWPADIYLLFAPRAKLVYFSHCVSWRTIMGSGALRKLARLVDYTPYSVLAPVMFNRPTRGLFLGCSSSIKNDRVTDLRYFSSERKAVLENGSYFVGQCRIPKLDRDKTILFVGAFTIEKGSNTVMQLVQQLDGTKFVVCTLSRSITKNDYNLLKGLKNVDLVLDKSGYELLPYYLEADLLISVSQTECFPLVITDAMAVGLKSFSFEYGWVQNTEYVSVIKSYNELVSRIMAFDTNYSLKPKENLDWSERSKLLEILIT